MSATAPRLIRMPLSGEVVGTTNITLNDRVLVIVGANGSGKTRLGVRLEKENGQIAHRVSAHRALNFPENVRPMDLEEAERRVLLGDTSIKFGTHEQSRNRSRWGSRPETKMLQDFEHLMTFLVSESFSVSDVYRTRMHATQQYEAPPATRLDVVKSVWENVLPNRRLLIEGGSVKVVGVDGAAPYHAREMSDGERSIFHLIGEAMTVPTHGLFIIDEPELHLHRAIQSRLWDAIECARPDCSFVYITHDLDFAASRKDASKVWLRNYVDGVWSWEMVPDNSGIPEPMLLEVIGSRRPILFVEGDKSSLDYFVYGKVLSEFQIIPCGSCQAVIGATASFEAINAVHHNRCFGLIDNDGRSSGDAEYLAARSVKTLPVALVENLFVGEAVLHFAATRLGHANDAINAIKERVFKKIEDNTDRVVSNLVRQEIEAKLRVFGALGNGKETIDEDFRTTCASIDVKEIWDRRAQEVRDILDARDYPSALRVYKSKGLHAEAGAVFGVRYEDQILRWLREKESNELKECFRVQLPPIIVEAPGEAEIAADAVEVE